MIFYVYASWQAHIPMCMCVLCICNVRVLMCVYACVCVCIYIYIHIHIHIHTYIYIYILTMRLLQQPCSSPHTYVYHTIYVCISDSCVCHTSAPNSPKAPIHPKFPTSEPSFQKQYFYFQILEHSHESLFQKSLE